MSEKEHKYLPVLLDISDKKILLIGAGTACAEKLRSLEQTGTSIRVIAPEIRPEFLNKDWIHLEKREYKNGDIRGFDIVYVGVNDDNTRREVLEEARKENALVNVVDYVPYSDFISPSVIQKKFFSVFISTFGKAPGMSKAIRQNIESKLDLELLDNETQKYIHERNLKKNQNA